MDWPYFDFKVSENTHPHLSNLRGVGYLYDDGGHRVVFDGAARTAGEWEIYLLESDERGTVR